MTLKRWQVIKAQILDYTGTYSYLNIDEIFGLSNTLVFLRLDTHKSTQKWYQVKHEWVARFQKLVLEQDFLLWSTEAPNNYCRWNTLKKLFLNLYIDSGSSVIIANIEYGPHHLGEL